MKSRSGWTSPTDLKTKVLRRWDSGELLAILARGGEFEPIDLPLRGPKAADIGDDLDAVRGWIDALERGSRGGQRYELIYGGIGGRHVGRNQIPLRAEINTAEQAWQLLGVVAEVGRFRELLHHSAELPAVRDWAATNPLRALAVADEWEQLLSAYRWLTESRDSGLYLRQVTAQGVDTKFIEHHRALLAQLVGVSRSATGFLAGLGLRSRPELIRLRFDPGPLGLPTMITEATFRLDELARLPADVRTAVIIENEITFLSVPIPDNGIVLWGKGFEVDRAGRLGWLSDADVHYWGDLDSHGFAILHQLRAWLPQTRSFLMDRVTLLAHRDRWVRDPTPTNAQLDRLTDEESLLYEDLVTDRLADSVRLEQERIDWGWATDRLPYLPSDQTRG
ncbi:hypothetical protein FOE78_02095 [Microlunatus elymi]|uniref:Wadjet protein JetD C-terminal domain-containing protein n=1 Tax=Microlunatus elymi TaxID=2596828 RepID=A0A516Q579_9ACTN|nr:DUF3322 and DUF2220 domain-containing protein [Microlunatus elymi]QDP98522.1 hypothetical protein FOE78_02095 [Microlunatus elymi]